MKQSEFNMLHKIEKFRHNNKLEELEIEHKNKMEEIKQEKEAKLELQRIKSAEIRKSIDRKAFNY